MKNNENQHDSASYGEVILFDNESQESSQNTSRRKRLVPGMFSSVTDAELIIQTLGSEATEYTDR